MDKVLETSLGRIIGVSEDGCTRFLGVPYAKAGRFAYATPVDSWEGELDATAFGPCCPQKRQYHEHLEHPERRFYHREFRDGLTFTYSEDCLTVNIYAPDNAKDCPVLVYIHGGGFDSGSNPEEPFRGEGLAARGILTVFVQYRVGPFGYFTHEDIQKEYGRDGNFGLDDQRKAVIWVKDHIAEFGGDPDNMTLCGQSAGAISIQYLCLNHENEGLFRRAVMMSGGGMFPKFALPKMAADTHEYWLDFLHTAGCDSLEELRAADIRTLLDAAEELRNRRKDNLFHVMPVVDGVLLPKPVPKLISNPLDIGYMIGYTNNDMYAPVMAFIGNRFGKANGAYVYFFDLDAPGDNNGAFHSSDLRYLFERLDTSWRPFGARDREVSKLMADYLANFARTGDPNGAGLPEWTPAKGLRAKVMHFGAKASRMGRANYFKLAKNMLIKGSPTA